MMYLSLDSPINEAAGNAYGEGLDGAPDAVRYRVNELLRRRHCRCLCVILRLMSFAVRAKSMRYQSKARC